MEIDPLLRSNRSRSTSEEGYFARVKTGSNNGERERERERDNSLKIKF